MDISFLSSRFSSTRRTWWRVLGSLILGGLLAYLANQLGWWWVTSLVGVAAGVLVRRRSALALCAVLGAGAWGLNLLLLAGSGDVARIAQVTGGLAGLGAHAGWVVMALTVVLGGALCLVGCWVALAVVALATQVSRAKRAGNNDHVAISLPPPSPATAGSIAGKDASHG